MTTLVRLVPQKCVDEYNGVSKQTGNAFTIGTWIVKGVLDGKEFVVKAFTTLHAALKDAASKSMMIDCHITIECKEWNGKYYNDVTMTGIENTEKGNEDVPSEAPVEVSKTTFNGGTVEEGGLPF